MPGPGIDEEGLRKAHNRLKKTVGSRMAEAGVYDRLSPRQAVEYAMQDEDLTDEVKAQLRAQFRESPVASATKGFGRGMALDTLASWANDYTPMGIIPDLLGTKVAPKVLGTKPVTGGEFVGKALETSPIQDEYNTGARMGGTIGGNIAATLLPFKYLKGIQAAGPIGQAAYRAALTAATSASMNVQDQGDAIKYGEQKSINPWGPIWSGVTSAGGSVAGSALAPWLDRTFFQKAAPYFEKALPKVALPNPGTTAKEILKNEIGRIKYEGGNLLKGLGITAPGIAIPGLMGGAEEWLQSKAEKYDARRHQTPAGRIAAKMAPDGTERFLQGAGFGSILEGLFHLHGLSGDVGRVPSADILSEIPPDNLPASGPVDASREARLANPRAQTGTPAAILQKQQPGANVQPVDTAKIHGERGGQADDSALRDIVTHATAEELRKTDAVAKQYIRERNPAPKEYWRDLEDGTIIPVWPVNGRMYGRYPNGDLADVTLTKKTDYEVMRYMQPDKTLPAGSAGPAIYHPSEHRMLPWAGRIKIDVNGTPHLILSRGKKEFQSRDTPYGMLPLDFSLGPSGLHPTEPSRVVVQKLPPGAKFERQKIRDARNAARASMQGKPSPVEHRLRDAPRLPKPDEVKEKVAPELAAVNAVLGVDPAAKRATPGVQSIEDQAHELASLFGVSYEEALADLMSKKQP